MIKEENQNVKDLFNVEMIASNCNVTHNSIDYSSQWNAIAFASSNLIHIFDFIKKKTVLTLKAHTSRINELKWISGTDIPQIISIGSDGLCIIFKSVSKDPFSPSSWKPALKINNDKASINSFDYIRISDKESYLCFYDEKLSLNLYLITDSGELIESKLLSKQKQKYIFVTISISVISDDYIMILTGGYDSKINIFTFNRNLSNENKITYHISLLGHQNAIKDISVNNPYSPTMIGSSSQDTYVRLWSIRKLSADEVKILNSRTKENITIFDEYESQTSYTFGMNENLQFHVLLESILSDHEESVSSVRFYTCPNKREMKILTSSMDFTVGLWYLRNNIWQKERTLGEMTGNKHSFFLAIFINNDNAILAYTFTGAMYLWEREDDSKPFISNGNAPHGHFNFVSDLCWDPKNSKYLMSTSKDQTTRIYANNKKENTWNEVGRPQIHGYDINSIAILNTDNDCICKYISASEEKIIRMFEPTYNLAKFLNLMSQRPTRFSEKFPNEYYDKKITEGTKQALGLMTKQAEIVDDEKFDISNFDPTAMLTNQEDYSIGYSIKFDNPPDEDFLTNHTLWPETNKLYGHSYEVYTIAASNKGDLFASANVAKTEKYAKLCIWSPESNTIIQKLDGHTLTIAQIEFSSDDSMILTVSRDQSWCLYKRQPNSKLFELFQYNRECHSRIIWSCSISKDSTIFATGSRDKFVKLWNIQDNIYGNCGEKEYEDSVTAVEIVETNKSKFIIVGLENGTIVIERLNIVDNKVTFEYLSSTQTNISFGSKVKRIRSIINDEGKVLVGACGEDNTVRIYSIKIDNL